MTQPDALDPTQIAPTGESGATPPLLRVRDLSVEFATEAGVVQAVDRVGFDIYPGETLALVGESGSGKSVTAMSILGLLTQRARLRAGQVTFEGRDLGSLSDDDMRRVRGNRIGMIFQEPMSSLNPVFSIGDQIGEPLLLHRGLSAAQVRQEVLHLLELVNMPDPERRIDEYPHQLSGGMRQRAMIAMALACRPSLLIADEPTTALDVTVQAQILDLLARLQAELGMSILIITHDLGVVASLAQRAIVMYAGRIVERSDVLGLFENPRHPYTAGLFESLPRIDLGTGLAPRLRPIEGSVPDALHFPSGCRFHPRCGYAYAPCAERAPPLVMPRLAKPAPDRRAACWYTEEHPEASYLSPDDVDPEAPPSAEPPRAPA
jgi:peptide/nickel transport system ATP-binding protein